MGVFAATESLPALRVRPERGDGLGMGNVDDPRI